jgi:hypothetical protein
MPANADNKLKSIIVKELALFLVIFLIGLVVLPLFVYVTGRSLFGEYAGSGFSDFYGVLHSELRSGQPVVWFLVLSPYLAWQFLRLTVFGFRRGERSQQ